MKEIIIILIFIFILIGGCVPKEVGLVCGNGILEEGEDPYTCCLDAGCEEGEFCRNNICIKSPVRCGYCQYPDGNVCKSYACCKNEDCDDNNPNTVDKCINPQTISAKCSTGKGLLIEEIYEEDEEISVSKIKKSCNGIPHGSCSDNKVCDDGVLKNSIFNCGCSRDKIIVENDCKSLDYEKTIKTAVVEVISENAEIPETTYYCDREECKISRFCDSTKIGCEKFKINFLDTINNKRKVTSIHMADDLMTLGMTFFGLPLKPWYSFYYIDDWYAQQSLEWTSLRKIKVDTTIFGPYKVSDSPPKVGRMDDVFSALDPYFKKIVNENNIPIQDFTLVNYVYFDDAPEGYGRFVSTADFNKGLTYTNIIMSIDNINVEMVRLAHEIAHILGAHDKYDGFICKIPEGIPEPNKVPLFPQTKACLMCGSIMLSETSSGTSVPITDTVICETTAKEIGWI